MFECKSLYGDGATSDVVGCKCMSPFRFDSQANKCVPKEDVPIKKRQIDNALYERAIRYKNMSKENTQIKRNANRPSRRSLMGK